MKIGFLGLGVMGLPMAKNLLKKSGCEVLGYDVAKARLEEFAAAGGTPVSDQLDIYKNCDVIMQILPTHAIIRDSVEKAVEYGKPGNIIIDLLVRIVSHIGQSKRFTTLIILYHFM